MKHLNFILYSLVLSLIGHACLAQNKTTQINPAVKESLDSIALEDQRYRLPQDVSDATLDSLAQVYHQPPGKIFDYLMAKQMVLDSMNLVYVEGILKKYGYPGKTLVGKPTNEAAFYVIQHSSKIKEYLPLLKKQVRQTSWQCL
ncbi:hypothetical protein [Taibaiella soli]|uniref:Uncharacterized protein n=1 Tax=Taibaiella soli TaxID=1649169 RepID=A0A2W2C0I9_9BACT|nr:hypothetical protein [Taibaiella soli]PZF73583.1 hypothetical protein DN068_07625 [Taibaiella soli]